jgi:hypothetical protein
VARSPTDASGLGRQEWMFDQSITARSPAERADSDEKREPASDIDTVVVDSLNALDLEWSIREANC